jgi:hypothetical protein
MMGRRSKGAITETVDRLATRAGTILKKVTDLAFPVMSANRNGESNHFFPRYLNAFQELIRRYKIIWRVNRVPPRGYVDHCHRVS